MSARPAILSEAGDGPILFYHAQSFYCQKVLFALHEKNVPFRKHEINVGVGDQFSDWYLELSSKGEVPLLKNGSTIVAGGAQIINYVERTYVGEPIRSLLPATMDEKKITQILQMSRIISRLPIGAISKGAFAHAVTLNLNPKMPFIPAVREALINSEERLIAIIQQQAESSQKYKSLLQGKANEISRNIRAIPTAEEYEAVLKKLKELLDLIESQLKDANTEWFLCDTVTILDICFGILLHRLDILGLEKKLWGDRPHIATYFHRLQQLPSFQQSIPNNFVLARYFWNRLPDQYKYAGLGLISASSLGLMSILGKAI